MAGWIAVAEETPLLLPRSLRLETAIRKHPDFTLLERYRCEDRSIFEAKPGSEILMFDVWIGEIALQNQVGIRPREELAVVIPPDDAQLVSVFALRADFPRVLHTNATPPHMPISLCLYAEKPRTVITTWTAERCLARIKQWLYLASEARLHGDDQPPEQLFILSGDELVIPANLDHEGLQKGKWQIKSMPPHANGGTTYLLEPLPSGGQDNSVEPIFIQAGDFGHQAVEFVPRTLGDLADIYQSRGVSILPNLQKWIQEVHQAKRLYLSADAKFTVILISATIRSATRLLEQRYAYLVEVGPVTLGKLLGVLESEPGGSGVVPVISFDTLPSPPDDSWRQRRTDIMEILDFPTPKHFRRWSGIFQDGPQGVLIGAGALGSEMLNHWIRSGWGEWTVVDEDYVRPHNLARHTALSTQIGCSKAPVVAALASATSNGTAKVKPIVADACDSENEELQSSILDAALVVDASADVQYPREASRRDSGGRHVSVFITPSGLDAVLLLEDGTRKIRLHALEGQYYRAILTSEWGAGHLATLARTFWSGRSCRDRSFVMPNTRMAGHAALLAAQIMNKSASDNACMRIWCSDPETGATQMHEIEPAPIIEERRGRFSVVLDQGLVDELKAQRQRALPNETGGVLLGYLDISRSLIVLVKGMPAPQDSLSTPREFVRGKEGVAEMLKWAAQLTMGQVRYLGEWHSHPWGCTSEPSSTDIIQISILSQGMAEEGLPVVSLIVGETSPSILVGEML